MKSRLEAALSTLFTGTLRKSIFEAISAKRRLALFNGDGNGNSFPLVRTLVSLQVQGIKSQKRSLHSSVKDWDEFSELGPPVTPGAGKLLKLATQKREPYGKIDKVKKHFSGRLLPAESSSRAKDVVHNRVRTSQAVLKVESHNDGSRYTVNQKSGNSSKQYNFVVDPGIELDSKRGSKLSGIKTSHRTKLTSVTIEDVPSTVDLSQLKEAISIFGEIASASMNTAPNGLDRCVVKFESIESRRKAVSAGGITVKSFHLPDTVAIRIENISNETADAAVHSACMLFGSLEGLARTKDNTVNAIYKVKYDMESEIILKQLNNTITDGRRWSAHLLERDSTNDEDGKCKLGLEICSHLAELKRQVRMKKIDAEDLEYLHCSIVHLEETPGISDPSC